MKTRLLRMLIVDDLEDWRLSLTRLLRQIKGVSVELAASGEAALVKIRQQDYDLVLLDLRMPSGQEGLEMLSEIKKLKPKTEVIMMSAYGDILTAVEAMKRGAIHFIPKEGDFDDIIIFEVYKFIRNAQLIADRELLISTKYRQVLRSKTAHDKGKALENLLAALLSSIDGFIKIGQNINTTTEEIDLAFLNGSRDPAWQKEGEIIVVECKNWNSKRVGKNELVSFERKIENRRDRCKLGFMVCTDEFTDTLTIESLRSSRNNIVIVPIDGKGSR